MSIEPRKDETPGDGNRRGFEAGRPMEDVHANGKQSAPNGQASSLRDHGPQVDDRTGKLMEIRLPKDCAKVLHQRTPKAHRMRVVYEVARRHHPKGVVAGAHDLPRILESVLYGLVRYGAKADRLSRLELHAAVIEGLRASLEGYRAPVEVLQ